MKKKYILSVVQIILLLMYAYYVYYIMLPIYRYSEDYEGIKNLFTVSVIAFAVSVLISIFLYWHGEEKKPEKEYFPLYKT